MTTNAVTTDATASGVAHSGAADADHDAAAASSADHAADAAQKARPDKAAADQPEPTATMVPAKDLAPWGRGRV